MHKLICFILFMFISCYGFAQQDSALADNNIDNSVEVDAVTYRMYLNEEWEELRAYGEQAIKLGYDFYYLRMRVGIAQYNLKHYRSASIHFDRARIMNPFEESATEYLFWCYIFTERYDDAMKLGSKASEGLAETLGLNAKKKPTFALMEGGVKIPDKSSLYDPMYYSSFGIGHSIKKSVSLFHSLSWLSQKSSWGSYQQMQYYLRASFPLARNWSVSPAVHALYLDVSPYSTGTYFVASAAATKQLRYFQTGAAISWSNLYNKTQLQGSLNIKYYPFANNKFSIGTSVNALQHDSGSVQTFFLHSLNWQPSGRWNLGASFYHGNALYFNEGNGYVVNNSYDKTKIRSTIMASYRINTRWDIYGLYQNEQRTEYFTNSSYQLNSLIVGIKFKP